MKRDCLRHWWSGDSNKLEYCKRCGLMRTNPNTLLKKTFYYLDDIREQGKLKKELQKILGEEK